MHKKHFPVFATLAIALLWTSSASAQVSTVVPEPASLGLLATGAVAFAVYRHWRGRK